MSKFTIRMMFLFAVMGALYLVETFNESLKPSLSPLVFGCGVLVLVCLFLTRGSVGKR